MIFKSPLCEEIVLNKHLVLLETTYCDVNTGNHYNTTRRIIPNRAEIIRATLLLKKKITLPYTSAVEFPAWVDEETDPPLRWYKHIDITNSKAQNIYSLTPQAQSKIDEIVLSLDFWKWDDDIAKKITDIYESCCYKKNKIVIDAEDIEIGEDKNE